LSARMRIGFAVSLGYSTKNHDEAKDKKHILFKHLEAYVSCIAGCEHYIREFCKNDEVALLVCEDVRESRSHIKKVHHAIISPTSDLPAYQELIPFRHIIDTVHFAEKAHSPLLQFADAYAFAFRRHAGGYAHADEMLNAMTAGHSFEFGDLELGGYKILAPYYVDVPMDISAQVSVRYPSEGV